MTFNEPYGHNTVAHGARHAHPPKHGPEHAREVARAHRPRHAVGAALGQLKQMPEARTQHVDVGLRRRHVVPKDVEPVVAQRLRRRARAIRPHKVC